MTIKREVNGQVLEFELTNEEMWQAFDKIEHREDVATVKFYANADDIPEDKLDAVAYRFRKLYNYYLDNDTDIRWELVGDAVTEVLGDED